MRSLHHDLWQSQIVEYLFCFLVRSLDHIVLFSNIFSEPACKGSQTMVSKETLRPIYGNRLFKEMFLLFST